MGPLNLAWAARFQAKRVEFCFIVWDAKKSPQILCNLTVDRLPKICQNVVTKEVNVLRRKQYETFYR